MQDVGTYRVTSQNPRHLTCLGDKLATFSKIGQLSWRGVLEHDQTCDGSGELSHMLWHNAGSWGANVPTAPHQGCVQQGHKMVWGNILKVPQLTKQPHCGTWSRSLRSQKMPVSNNNSWWANVKNRMQVTSGYYLQQGLPPSILIWGTFYNNEMLIR